MNKEQLQQWQDERLKNYAAEMAASDQASLLPSEKNRLAHHSHEVVSLIEDLRVKHGPITSAEQLRTLLSPVEYELAVIEKLKQTSLQELVESIAEEKGYENVDEMLVADEKQARTKTRRTGPSANIVTGAIELSDSRPVYEAGVQVMRQAFDKHIGKQGAPRQ